MVFQFRLPHFHSVLRIVYWGSVGMACAVAVGYAWFMWSAVTEESRTRLMLLSSVVADSSQSLFNYQAAALRQLAVTLTRQHDLGQPQIARKLLDDYLAAYPDTAGIELVAPDGQVLLSTAIPPGQPLPDLRHSPALWPILRDAMHHHGVGIYRPVHGLPGGQWAIRLMLTAYAPSGKASFLLDSLLYPREIERLWRDLPKPRGTAAGLLRSDFYMEGYWPVSPGDMARIFAEPQGGILADTLIRHPGRDQGFYEGFVTADHQYRLGAFTRLRRYPLVAFASLPRSDLLGAWWRRMEFPFALLLLDIGISWLAYHWITALYLRWEGQKKHLEQSLTTRATHDALTGLANREGLRLLFEQALARAEREERLLAVCFLDLDGFKPVNDVHGHAAGDDLLRELAQRIRATLRGADTVARLGGDEFVLLLEGFRDLGELDLVLARIREEIGRPFPIAGDAISLGASLGLTIYPFDEVDVDGLLRHADLAMYAVKIRSDRAGDGWVQLYHPDLGAMVADEVPCQGFLQALAASAVALRYQPIVALDRGRVVGVEALPRWYRDGRESSPGEFLSFLGTRELQAMGRFVLQTGLRQLARWRALGLDIYLSINVSREELVDPDFADAVLALLAEQPALAPQALVLEVVEAGEILDRPVVMEQLQRLRGKGVKIALDDMGNAHTSLLQLKRLPIDIIKIDQDFVQDLPHRPQDLVFVEGLVKLGTALDLTIIAEGVESGAHIAVLRETGVDQIQGYAITQPLEGEAVADFARNFVLGPGDPDALMLAVYRHVEWLRMLQETVLSPSRWENPDPDPCPLTGWLRAHAADLPGIEVLISEHEAIRRTGDELIALRRSGDRRALRRLLGHLRAQSRTFLERLAQALRAKDEQAQGEDFSPRSK